ncbi:hypothetical protein CDLVIII_1363 [Clostridium sp. DL-VIII]|uniref:hypothetical protein n=1 Tax=Clostridium sp. DL-VIII TaxID=641107 RepID=UPI00023AF852|nr:hypothetical protein [Clostridium sp. DL-VIII]EHI98062.1 hypothetical protein CDLVIII_1363 [Clostridium sp. DL-VIII]
MTKKQILIDNLSDIKKYKSKKFSEVIKEAFCTIIPSKRRLVVILIVLVILAYPIEISVKSNNTLSNLKDLLGLSNGVIMAMFAILFTGYALFQALINRNTLKILFLSKSKHGKSLFSEYNLYFFAMCILYVLLIIINYIGTFIIIYIGTNNIVNINEEAKNIILRICIYLYLFINIFAIIEIKSFIYNLFQCFNISAMSTMIESLSKYDDNLHEK